MDVAQVYASPVAGGWEAPKRLAAFGKVDLAPGASTRLTLKVDPRLLATFDTPSNSWRIAGGRYRLMLAESSRDIKHSRTVDLPAMTLPSNWRPGAPAGVPTGSFPERGR
jgi:beta-glucosidase